jgi:hypothetical protein
MDIRWRVYENRVLRRIFVPKRGGVTTGWRICKMRSFTIGYSSLYII